MNANLIAIMLVVGAGISARAVIMFDKGDWTFGFMRLVLAFLTMRFGVLALMGKL